MRRSLLAPMVVALTVSASLLGAGMVGAHTETDLVAVPAGSAATVTLKPTHGCAGSPTVQVRIRAEVAGAVAGEVDGWTASSSEDGEGRSVLEWSGGVLPADATGAFPVDFTAPDEPGRLLLFPAIQTCENGEQLAWISGDPTGDYPAPRLLVLPPDASPAASIDEVPADAPGRDQLVAIVDVDNPAATPQPGSDGAPVDGGDLGEAPAASPDGAVDGDAAVGADSTGDGDEMSGGAGADSIAADDVADDDGSALAPVVIGLVVVAMIGAGIGVWAVRRNADPASPG